MTPPGKSCLKRSIPACAGEPALGRRMYPAFGVYPRVCGGTAGVWLPPAV